MQLAILADIHGNHLALEACISHARAQGIDTFLFLGDYLGELPYPRQTLELFHTLSEQATCLFVRGNREDYLLRHRAGLSPEWAANNSASGCLLDTYLQLTEEDLDFFAALPLTVSPAVEPLPFVLGCHASPRDTNEALLPESTVAQEILENCPAAVLACGHTHRHCIYRHAGKVLVNPGSVGIPVGEIGHTRYAVLREEDGVWQPELLRLPYDFEAAVRELRESALYAQAPWWCALTVHLLQTGRDLAGTVLRRASELCRIQYGECHWPDIPESCWQAAAAEYHVQC